MWKRRERDSVGGKPQKLALQAERWRRPGEPDLAVAQLPESLGAGPVDGCGLFRPTAQSPKSRTNASDWLGQA